MKIFYIIFLTILTFNACGQNKPNNLNLEMTRLKTETVLIVRSQAIDEYPLWSPKSDFIACNIEGKWYKFRLINIELTDTKWRGQTIGVLKTKDAYSELTNNEQFEFEKVSKFNPRELKTKDGTKVELKMKEMSVSLVVTKKGEKAKILWASGGENCHSLVLSPDENYVAYLCEMTGLLIMKIK
ncbi:MAG: hypothetical protein EAY66_04230 [Sphingobacteriales bacterium]|nr:MAG: hypothetical protein EAY66_04230 [Sphingobacteriales bacterium]